VVTSPITDQGGETLKSAGGLQFQGVSAAESSREREAEQAGPALSPADYKDAGRIAWTS